MDQANKNRTQPTDTLNLGQTMAEAMQRNQLTERYAKLKKTVLADADIQHFLADHQSQLNKDVIERDFANLYEFYSQKKLATQGGDPVHRGYDPVLALIDQRITVLYQPSKATVQAQKMKEQANLVATIHMPNLVKRAELDDFSMDDTDRIKAYTAVIDFISAYLADPKQFHKGVYIHGPYGVGKTHLMGALANELALEQVPVTLVHFPSLAVDMRSSIGDKSVNIQDKITAIKAVPILVLDDLGAESLTPWIRDDILGVILEFRMQNDLPVFFTSNFSMEQLEKEHLPNTKDGYEPMKAERIMQRIRYLSTEVGMYGENKRL